MTVYAEAFEPLILHWVVISRENLLFKWEMMLSRPDDSLAVRQVWAWDKIILDRPPSTV